MVLISETLSGFCHAFMRVSPIIVKWSVDMDAALFAAQTIHLWVQIKPLMREPESLRDGPQFNLFFFLLIPRGDLQPWWKRALSFTLISEYMINL